MKKTKKFLLITALIFTLCLCFASGVSAKDLAATGKCGENVYWKYNKSTGEVIISGKGKMSTEFGFFYQNGIKKVTVKKGVTAIDNAFACCEELVEVNMSDDVKELGDQAFSYCINLKKITLSENITKIGEMAFEGCSKIKKITVPEGTTSIEFGAFRDCSSLEKIILSEKTEKIGEMAFSGCTKLKKITLPDSVKEIGPRAFEYCRRLETVKLSENLCEIGICAFSYCQKLKEIKFPDSDIKIGVCIFDGCSRLEKITLGKNFYLGDESFGELTNLKEIVVHKDNKFYTVVDGVLMTKDKTEIVLFPVGNKYDEYIVPDTVTVIGGNSFDNARIKTVTLFDSVKKIEARAFVSDKINYVNIGKGTVEIEDGAFEDCNNLTSINVSSENEKYISLDGVLYDKAVTELFVYPKGKKNTVYTIPETVKDISNMVSSYVEELFVHSSVENLNEYSWESNLALEKIHIDENHPKFSSVDGVLFSKDKKSLLFFPRCRKVEVYIVPEGTEKIADSAFENCINLFRVKLPETLEVIEFEAFQNCENLKSINFPESLSIIGEWAFFDCVALEKIIIPEGIEYLGWYTFAHCENLESVTLPKSIKGLGYGCFCDCPELTEVIYEGGKSLNKLSIEEENNDIFSGFEITKKKIKKPAAVKIKSVKSKKAKNIVLKWKTQKGVDGYHIRYSTYDNFDIAKTKNTFVKKSGAAKFNLKKLKSGKTYYIKVRAYKAVNGKRIYGAFSDVKSIKAK